MIEHCDNQPMFVVHSKRKRKCWPGPLGMSFMHLAFTISSMILVDLRLYVFAGGQRQTLPAPDYHLLSFMSDDEEEEEEFKTPVKAEGSTSTPSTLSHKCSVLVSPTKCSGQSCSSQSHTPSINTPSTPLNQVGSSSSANLCMPKVQNSYQTIQPSTPLSYVDQPTPRTTPLSKNLSPHTTELLLSLDGLMTPKQKNLDDYDNSKSQYIPILII